MLGVALFAQGVMAANACDAVHGNISQAFSSQAVAEEMPCHDDVSSNGNACLDHCTLGDRVNVDQVTHDFAVPSVAVLVVDAPVQQSIASSHLVATRAGIDTGPPVSIRFCSFQI